MQVLLLGVGCASQRVDEYPDYRTRVETAEDGPLKVSVAALSPAESVEVFGIPLAGLGIQPVWVEVDNRDTAAYWFLPQGMDPHFFPFWEAAEAFTLADGVIDPQRRDRFRELALPDIIPAQSTASGFVLANLDEGFKFIHADFLRTGELRHVSLIVGVPDFRADYREQRTFERPLFAEGEVLHIGDDLEAFRQALLQLPCCATNKSGSRDGDPLNLVIVGGERDAFSALAERGWSPTEITWSGSILKMISSTLQGEPYPYAPISPMYLYGRSQDIALQKARDNIHQRNHLRLWRAPMTFRDKPVWVGQISRDIGTRLTIYSPYLTTHKIDPDVDEARSALAEDMAYSQHLQAIGLVGGVGRASRDAPRGNLTTDPYFTDGYRAVMVFDAASIQLDDIEFLPWIMSRDEGADGS